MPGKFTFTFPANTLAQAILEKNRYDRLSFQETVLEQAKRLACSNFNGIGGLFQEASKEAPSVEYLRSLPERLGWRIKRRNRPVLTQYEARKRKRGTLAGTIGIFRKKGSDGRNLKAGEIERRIASRFYMASGWLNAFLVKSLPGVRNVKIGNDRAKIQVNLQGSNPRIVLVNSTPNAAAFAERTGYIERAIENRIIDMNAYVRRKLNESAGRFKPNGRR